LFIGIAIKEITSFDFYKD